jgi:hypothetical protein
MYDHTIARLPHEHENFHWSPMGLGETDRPEENRLSLATLLERNGHIDRRDLILKMDIEGAEWAALLYLPDRFLDHFRQILIEFHDCSHLDNAGHVQTMLRVFKLLNATHRVAHIHANNFASYDLVGGIPFPSTLEVSYARQDVCAMLPSKRTFPTSLDAPNDASRADYVLPFWGLLLCDQQAAETRALRAEFLLEEREKATRRETEEIRESAHRAVEQAKDEALQAKDETLRAKDEALQAKDETLQARDEAERLREWIQAIHASTSWRITRPMRGLVRLMTGTWRFFSRRPEPPRVLPARPPRTLSPHVERVDRWLRFAAGHPRNPSPDRR